MLLILACLIIKNGLILINYFSALVLHELAHLFVATKRGYKLKLIKLDMFGMSVNLDEQIDDRDSFAINIAGPLFNLLLCVVCLACYWLFPISYTYLNTFCFANLTLAMFNLLPIYPLDGGKVFKGIIRNDKGYKIFDRVVRIVFICLFALLFIFSCKHSPNWFCLVFIVFLFSSIQKSAPTLSIFKNLTRKHFEKVVMLKVDENESLFALIKKIKHGHYTIFYLPKSQKSFDEDSLLELATKFPLTTTLKQIK